MIIPGNLYNYSYACSIFFKTAVNDLTVKKVLNLYNIFSKLKMNIPCKIQLKKSALINFLRTPYTHIYKNVIKLYRLSY